MIERRTSRSMLVLAFVAGLLSSLYLPTPVGILAMFDLLSFALAVPVFLMSYSQYEKNFKRVLFLSLLWLATALISDFWRGCPRDASLKNIMIIINSICMLIVGQKLVSRSHWALALFFLGNAISQVISLYYFQNGALMSFAARAGFEGGSDMSSYLHDKQIYPLWINMFLVVGGMVLLRTAKFSIAFCAGGFFFLGMFVLTHGGSRSSFLIIYSAGFLMITQRYFSRLYQAMFRQKLLTVFLAVLAAVCFKVAHTQLAKSGFLGEAALSKYENEKAEETNFLDDRADILINWPFLWRSPLIGAGSHLYDRWGYLNKSPFVQHINPYNGQPIWHVRFAGHSALVYAWTGHGIGGLLFWLYVLWLIFDFIGKRDFIFREVAPIVIYVLISLVWDILFSPYGGFRGKVMVAAAFLAMTLDRRYFNSVLQGMGVRPMVGNGRRL